MVALKRMLTARMFNARKYQAHTSFYGFDNILSFSACNYFMNCELLCR